MRTLKDDKKKIKTKNRTSCQGRSVIVRNSIGEYLLIRWYCKDYKHCEICNSLYISKMIENTEKTVMEYGLYNHVVLTIPIGSSYKDDADLLQKVFKLTCNKLRALSYEQYVTLFKSSYKAAYKKDKLKAKYQEYIADVRRIEFTYSIHIYNSENNSRYPTDPDVLKETNPELYANLADEVDRKLSKILGADINDVIAGNIFPDKARFHYIRVLELSPGKKPILHFHVLASFFLLSIFAETYNKVLKISSGYIYPNTNMKEIPHTDFRDISKYIEKELTLDYIFSMDKYGIDLNIYTSSKDPATKKYILTVEDEKDKRSEFSRVLNEDGKPIILNGVPEKFYGHKYETIDGIMELPSNDLSKDDYTKSINALFRAQDKELRIKPIGEVGGITTAYQNKRESTTIIYLLDELNKKASETVRAFPLNPKFKSKRLTKEQKAFIDSINKTQLVILTGCAGSGKSTATANILLKYDLAEKSVLITGNSSKAVWVMQEKVNALGIPTDNIDFQNICLSMGAKVNYYRFSYDIKELNYDLIIVDEASLIEPEKLLAIFKAAKPGSKIILIGDKYQMQPVNANTNIFDLLPLFSAKKVLYELTENKRADGSAALLQLHKDVRESKVDKLINIIKPYSDESVIELYNKSYIFLTKSNKTCREIYNLTSKNIEADKFQVGDRVICSKNCKEYGIINGEAFVIIGRSGKDITLKNDKRTITVKESKIKLITSVCMTVEKFQGSEADKICVIIDESALRYISMNWLYTAITRARKELVILNKTSLSDEELINKISTVEFQKSNLIKTVKEKLSESSEDE